MNLTESTYVFFTHTPIFSTFSYKETKFQLQGFNEINELILWIKFKHSQLWNRKQFTKLRSFKIVKNHLTLFASTYMVWNFLTYLRFKATLPRILRPTAFSGHKLQFTARSCQGNFCLFVASVTVISEQSKIWKNNFSAENLPTDSHRLKINGIFARENTRELLRLLESKRQ